MDMQKKTAIIALLGIGLLAGAAVGLGVGLSRRNRNRSAAPDSSTILLCSRISSTAAIAQHVCLNSADAGTVESTTATGADGETAIRELDTTGMTDEVPGSSGNMARAVVPDATGAEAEATPGQGSCAAGDRTCTAAGDYPELTPPSMAPGAVPGCNSILDIATATPELSTLVKAISVR